MPALDLDGARLNYVIEGAGEPTLAFLHGWCSRLEHWEAQAAAFAPTHRIVRVDRRGMGRSSTTVPAAGAAQHADDLLAVLDANDIDRVVVFGHAGGGPSALAFAARHADRTAALVMVDSNLHAGSGAGSDDPFGTSVEQMVVNLRGPDGDAFFARTYAGYFGRRAPAAVRDAAVAHAVGLPRELAVSELLQMIEDTVGLAGAVRCPVLWASANPGDSRTVRKAFSSTTVTIGHVVGSGHFVHVEVPEQLNPMIAAFLEDLEDLAG